jgi:hypothetical protein
MYKPSYSTKINELVIPTKANTLHTDYIDWDNYPFEDPLYRTSRYCTDEQYQAHINQLKKYLAMCEQYKFDRIFASDYGGVPRIWKEVVGVGMASIWPYWKPRPTIIVDSLIGSVEYIDWTDITDVKNVQNV